MQYGLSLKTNSIAPIAVKAATTTGLVSFRGACFILVSIRLDKLVLRDAVEFHSHGLLYSVSVAESSRIVPKAFGTRPAHTRLGRATARGEPPAIRLWWAHAFRNRNYHYRDTSGEMPR